LKTVDMLFDIVILVTVGFEPMTHETIDPAIQTSEYCVELGTVMEEMCETIFDGLSFLESL